MRLVKLDNALLREVDERLKSASRKAGDRLACKPGCTSCCIGVFTINQLDAARLGRGLREMKASDPARAQAVRRRAEEVVRIVKPDFPGDAETGLLEDEDGIDGFTSAFSDVACPALDPTTGLCDLYDSRPMSCRTYGLPILHEMEKLPPCSLCFQGSSLEEIENCRVEPDPDGLENAILCELLEDGARACQDFPMERSVAGGGPDGLGPETIVAYALVAGERQASDDRTDESRAAR
ncbi:MAG: YkgJ family cysteine cluster protein [Acidobacteria bacterium]|nr:MAG: YkgJ family cysteine cluster protein [Acidobacteriota bacterium]